MHVDRFLSSARFFVAPDGPGGAGTPVPPGSGASSTPTQTSSGATPSSPAPAVTPPPTEVTPSGEAFDFGAIFDGPPAAPSAPSPVTTTPPAATPSVPAAATPSAPPGAEPAALPGAQPPPVQPQPGAEPGSSGQPPVGATPTPASGQSPPLDPYDPVGLVQAIQANEAATVEHVAATMFQLSKEEAEALETDTLGTIPKLMAKAFVKTQMNVLLQLGRMIPEMVRRNSEGMKNHSENENLFYQTWPQIDRAKHKALVDRFGVTYRTMYPNATKEQMIADLGPMIMLAAKIQPTNGSASVSPSPVTPIGVGGVRPPQPSPFVPAVPGPAATGQPEELNPWEAIFRQEG